MEERILIPVDKYAHAGYFLLIPTALYWLGRMLSLFGIHRVVSWCETFPYFATIIIVVVLPAITLLLGLLSYVRHPHERRKLAYQSLIALSAVGLVLFIISVIDGTVM